MVLFFFVKPSFRLLIERFWLSCMQIIKFDVSWSKKLFVYILNYFALILFNSSFNAKLNTLIKPRVHPHSSSLISDRFRFRP